MIFESLIHVLVLIPLLGYSVLMGVVVNLKKWFSSKFFGKGKVPSDVPPGSMGWPLLGDTLAFIKPHNSNSLGNFLQQRCTRYGQVFKSHLFGVPTIVSCDLELNTYILQNEGKLFSTNYPTPFQKVLGEESILFVSGQLHKRLRSVAVTFINTSKINPHYLSFIDKSTTKMIESWKEDGLHEIFFIKEAKQFTFHLILKGLLGMDVVDDKVLENIKDDCFTIMKGVISLPIYILGYSYNKAIIARKRVRSTLRMIINESKGKFIDEILIKSELNDEEKVGIVLSLLLGGYETTSELLGLVVYFLACSPGALHEIKEEHKSLKRKKLELGEPHALSVEDYKQMKFTFKVINEALRCGNLAKYVHRKALKDVKYKGFLIPSGWQVLPIFTATHLDPSMYENPTEFNPWRWDNEGKTSRKATPFGGGLRFCPGADLAKLITAFFLHHFVLEFTWKTGADECPISHPFLGFKREMLLQIEPA